ncbi:MAG: glycosyltransferase [bacterium]|nr:glycosyltransferase [bacterium]
MEPNSLLVSLIIPTYQREQELIETLQCAIRQTYKPLEIILIDQTQHHSPNTLAFIQQHADQIQYHRPEFASLTKARNLGIKLSKGEILVFIDDDVTFSSDFIHHHVSRHQLGADLVQGRVLEPNTKTIAKNPSWLHRTLKFSGSDTSERSGPTNIVTGCNFSVSRAAIEKIGLFDENFQGIAIREDSDFGYRAYRAGLCIWFEPKALVYHKRSTSGGVEAHQKTPYLDYWYFFCESYFSRKHFSKWVVWRYRFRILKRSLRALWLLFLQAEKDAKKRLADKDQDATIE